MIGVKGQYLFIFSIGDKRDIILPEDLTKFNLITTSGGNLPEFELNFILRDESLIPYFNNLHSLSLSYGKDTNSLVDVKLGYHFPSITRLNNENYRVQILGTIDAPEYNNVNRTKIHKGTSKQVMQEVLSYFKFESNINVDDKMNWIQYNTTDAQFISDVWTHCNCTSFPLVGITRNSKFKFLEAKYIVQKGPSYRVTPYSDTDIEIEGEYNIVLCDAFLDQWAGGGLTSEEFNLETGEVTNLEARPIPNLFSINTKINSSPKRGLRTYKPCVTSSNLHPTYNLSYLKNIVNLTYYSSTKLSFGFNNTLLDIDILDLISFSDSSTVHVKTSTDITQGLYLVSKCSITLEQKSLNTYIEANREAVNQLRV